MTLTSSLWFELSLASLLTLFSLNKVSIFTFASSLYYKEHWNVLFFSKKRIVPINWLFNRWRWFIRNHDSETIRIVVTYCLFIQFSVSSKAALYFIIKIHTLTYNNLTHITQTCWTKTLLFDNRVMWMSSKSKKECCCPRQQHSLIAVLNKSSIELFQTERFSWSREQRILFDFMQCPLKFSIISHPQTRRCKITLFSLSK